MTCPLGPVLPDRTPPRPATSTSTTCRRSRCGGTTRPATWSARSSTRTRCGSRSWARASRPMRRAQQEMSIFVEVGWDDDSRAAARPVRLRLRLRRVHQLHAAGRRLRPDGQGLPHPPARRPHERPHATSTASGPRPTASRPLYVWGPGPSGVTSPRPPRRLYDDGTRAFCEHLRDGLPLAHGELQLPAHELLADYERPTQEELGAALPTRSRSGDDPPDDGYALVPDRARLDEVRPRARTTTSPRTHRREGHALPGDPLPQGLDRLQARVERRPTSR